MPPPRPPCDEEEDPAVVVGKRLTPLLDEDEACSLAMVLLLKSNVPVVPPRFLLALEPGGDDRA